MSQDMNASTDTRTGSMLLISGPSGCGKSTICKRLLLDDDVVFSVSATTREPRPGEIDGQHYHFLSPESFRSKIAEGAFIEHAEVPWNMYGTLKAPMEAAIAEGKVYLVEIDVQGALQLKALQVDGIYVFVAPPTFEILRERLSGRGTETPEVLERRWETADDEYRARERHDHLVVNDDLEKALAEIRRISGLPDRAPTEAPLG